MVFDIIFQMRFYMLLLLGFVINAGNATTYHVGKGQTYSSIKEALSTAVEGDTVMVHQGQYQEGNLIIDKSIVFIGVGRPVLDGQKKYEVLSIKSDNVVVDGFVVQNSGHSSMEELGGIKVYDSRNVTITRNELKHNFFGIYLHYGKNCLISYNRVSASAKEEQQIGNGIHCWKSDSLRIIGNTISGHRDGIYFEFVTGLIIWRNISFGNIRYGLHFMFSNNDAYITNLFRNNGAGVAVMFTKNVKMFNNTFEDNWGDASHGLLLKEISDSYIFNNRFIRNTSGIYMEGTNRIIVEKN